MMGITATIRMVSHYRLRWGLSFIAIPFLLRYLVELVEAGLNAYVSLREC